MCARTGLTSKSRFAKTRQPKLWRAYTPTKTFLCQLCEELRRLGHDVVTTYEAGRASQSVSDEAVVGFASSDGRVVLTLNRKHFVRLHSTGRIHAGIIVCTFDLDFIGQAGRIHAAIGSQTALSGLLIRVNRPVPET